MSITRLVSPDDAPALAQLCVSNRDFMAPYEPDRAESYFTEAGQSALIGSLLERNEQGQTHPRVIVDEDGEVVGRITLNEIVRGPAQFCSMGYLVSQSHNGRGFATAAVREVLQYAFEELKLHRIQAGTLLDNFGSQRVLERNGFLRYGMAPDYIKIAGRWQDHYLFQVLNPNPV